MSCIRYNTLQLYRTLMEESKVLLERDTCELLFAGKSLTMACRAIFYQNRTIQINSNKQCRSICRGSRRKSPIQQNEKLRIQLSLAYIVSIDQFMQKQKQSGIQRDYLQIKFKNKKNNEKFRLVILLKENEKLTNFIENYLTSYVWLRNFNRKYQIMKQISTQQKDRVSNIYQVRSKMTSKKYWLKLYSKDSFFNDKHNTLEKTIINQIQIQNKVQKKWRIGFDKFYEDNSNYYLIYEKLPKKTLSHFLTQMNGKEIQLVKIKIIIKSLLKIVADLKKKQLVQGNIKASNIVFLDDEQSFKPYLIDFSHSYQTYSQNKLSSFGPDYGTSAPQLFKGRRTKSNSPSYKSDVFSIGVILFSLLFKKGPISKQEKYDYMDHTSFKGYPQIDFKGLKSKSVSVDLLDFLVKILSYDPNERLQPEQALSHSFLKIKRQQISKSDTIFNRKSTLKQDKVKQQQRKIICKIVSESTLHSIRNIYSSQSNSKASPSEFIAESKRRKLKAHKDQMDGNLDSSDLDDQHSFSVPVSSEMKPSWQSKIKGIGQFNTV